MKKFLFFISAVILLSACNRKNQRQENQGSIADVEKRNQEIKDSLDQIRIDSLSLIAWGDAKFGMSQKEVFATKAFNGSDVYGNSISMKYENCQIADTKMGIGTFWANFKMNELCNIEIQTYNQTANYIDDLENDAICISYEFEEKYGESTYSFGREISLSDFNEGDEFLFKKWEIGEKSIYILFGEVYSGSEYYYRIVIENSNYPTKKDTKEEEENKQREKEKKEKKKYQF